MEEKEKLTTQEVIDMIPIVDGKTNKIVEDIINEDEDFDKVKKLTAIFNMNQAKRNAIRIIKLNTLLDSVSDQMLERIKKRPNAFSDDSLLSYYNVIQSSIDRANKSVEQVNDMSIQLNQININVNDEFNRESRDRITDAVKNILKKLNEKTQPNEYAEIIEPNDVKIVEAKEVIENDANK